MDTEEAESNRLSKEEVLGEQGWGGELHYSHEPGVMSKPQNFKDSVGDWTTHNISVKAVRHREIGHAESMLRQSAFSRSNKGIKMQQPRKSHRNHARN